jgi:hypothetical protein
MHFTSITTAATFSALLLATTGVFAQQYGQSSPEYGQPSQSTSASVDQATIGKFASALGMVQTIQQQTSRQLQAVENNEQAQGLQMKAQEDMIDAVEANGLTVQEYNGLATRMQQDPDLYQQVMERMPNR